MTTTFRVQVESTKRISGWVLALLVSFAVAWVIVIPYFLQGTASGHDFEFHMASWLDVASQWKQGVIYPHWTATTNYGFGEPRYIFYPPLSWLLGAALVRTLPDLWVSIAFVVLVQTFAGLAAYFLARRFASERAALLGAVGYAANPYALLMIYIRSDFAEQLACAFLPLVFLNALRMTKQVEERTDAWPALPLFAVSYAAVWLSNAPAAVIASYALALLWAWAALRERSIGVAVRGGFGLALGLGLAAFYIVPAAYEQRWVNIGQALSGGLLPAENFLFTALLDVEHTWFNWIASICAVLLVFLAGAAILRTLLAGRGDWQDEESPKARTTLVILYAAATLLMLRVTMPLWSLLPKLRFVQFPWRWMSVLAIVFAVFIAAAACRRHGWAWLVMLVVMLPWTGNFLVQNGWWDFDEMPMMGAAINSGVGFDGTDEYDPLGDDHSDLPKQARLAQAILEPESEPGSTPIIDVRSWTTKNKEIVVDAPQPVRIALRVINYPAWEVRVNGAHVKPGRVDDVNQMVVEVGEGRSVIQVRFGRTPDRLAGLVLTWLSVVLIGLAWNWERHSKAASVTRPNE